MSAIFLSLPVNLLPQREVLNHIEKTPVKLAEVANGTPIRKSWHVERRHVMESVFEALAGSTGPHLVRLEGDSGAGKTTAASEIIRRTDIREIFSDGIVWLTVNEGAKQRLPALMMSLARMVYEDVGGSVGRPPTQPNDGAAYIKQRIDAGHGGKGLKYLVVADNVLDKGAVSELLETGMWVLLTTRDEELVTSWCRA